MSKPYFNDLIGSLLQRWPEKAVREEQITGALKTSLNAAELVNALAEVFRLSPGEVEIALSELGLGDLIARQRLQAGEKGRAQERQALCEKAPVSPFPELFRLAMSPDPCAAELPGGLGASLRELSEKVAAEASSDPFLQLYHEGVEEYYSSFMKESAPLICDEIERAFPGEKLHYLVTTGIGANEQFCHYAAALNNADPKRKLTWLVIHSPLQLRDLP